MAEFFQNYGIFIVIGLILLLMLRGRGHGMGCGMGCGHTDSRQKAEAGNKEGEEKVGNTRPGCH